MTGGGTLEEMLGGIMLNRIYQMDCLEGMKLIPDGSVDMILCDLPYGVTARNKWDSVIPFDPLWNQYERVIKDNGAIVLTCQGLFASRLTLSNERLFRYDLVWEKDRTTGFLNANKQPLRCHEQILIFYKNQPTYNPQITVGHSEQHTSYTFSIGSNYNDVDREPHTSKKTWRYPRSIQKFNVVNNNGSEKVPHPTQKPVALFEYLIRTYTNVGDVVLDNCMGSGTTAVAAVNTGRHFIGFETEPQYIEIANKRLEALV